MNMQEVVGSFMADCKLRGLSTRTLEGYSHHLAQLSQLTHDYPPKPDIIQEFLANVNGGPYSRDAFFRSFRALSNYGHKRFKTKNFMKSVTRPRIPKQVMPTLSYFELSLLAASMDAATPRDKAILCLLIDTAIRSGEAANLQRRDIQETTVTIHGKTGYRVAPISPSVRDRLLALPIYDDGYVFHGEGASKYHHSRLQKTGFYQVVRKYVRLSGYSGRQFGPQLLRRSFGKFWLLAGGDLKSLSLILGHASVATTDKYYTPLAIEDVVHIHREHTPIKVFEEVA